MSSSVEGSLAEGQQAGAVGDGVMALAGMPPSPASVGDEAVQHANEPASTMAAVGGAGGEVSVPIRDSQTSRLSVDHAASHVLATRAEEPCGQVDLNEYTVLQSRAVLNASGEMGRVGT